MKSLNCSSRLCPANIDYYSFPLHLFLPYNPVDGNKKQIISNVKIYNLYCYAIIFHSLDINTIILVRNILSCVQHTKDVICCPPSSQILLQMQVYTYIHTHTHIHTLSNTQTHALAYQLSVSVIISLWTFKKNSQITRVESNHVLGTIQGNLSTAMKIIVKDLFI